MERNLAIDNAPPSNEAGLNAVVGDLASILELLDEGEWGSESLHLLEGLELIKAVSIAESIGQRVDVLRARLAAQVDRASRNVPGEQSILRQLGMRNAVNALQFLTGSSAATARKRILLGRTTEPDISLTGAVIPARYPAVGAGLEAGHLGVEAAQLITKTLDQRTLKAVASKENLEWAEVTLVALATGTAQEGDFPQNCDLLQASCTTIAQFLDQDGPEPKDSDLPPLRELSFGKKFRGVVPIRGMLVPEAASLLSQLLEAVNNPRVDLNKVEDPEGNVEASKDTESQQEFGRIAAAIDDRSPATKRHDAFMSLLGVLARHPDTPLQGGSPVTVLVQTTEQTLREHLEQTPQGAGSVERGGLTTGGGQGAGGGLTTGGGHATGGEQGTGGGLVGEGNAVGEKDAFVVDVGGDRAGIAAQEMNSAAAQAKEKPTNPMGGISGFLFDYNGLATPTSMPFIRQAGCSGSLQRVVLAENGSVNHVSSPSRIFNGHQRRAIAMRDGGCAIPLCDVPPTWCEIHHVVEWSKGGPTTIKNGVSLCWYHHRTIDTNGWHIKMIDNLPHVQAPLWADPRQKWHRVRPPTMPPPTGLIGLEELGQRLLAKLNQLVGGSSEIKVVPSSSSEQRAS
ncbi:DUF222 domain-containing protein [Jonesiaceae bacterium BS-20]|uniref:DUF222 domain-containing protein n=1 Tax=Jonesiaceae bacterium BS-20 TaxID=3120821 RepID=A0AAU7DVT7_9MICO